GLRCIPLPGASSITAAISVAGAVTPSQGEGGFVFAGFLPTKSAERLAAVQQLALQPRCTVLLEAPHRIADLAAALATLGERPVTLAREITKQFEDIATMPASALPAWLQAVPQRSKGEFAVVLHPVALGGDEADADALRVLRLLLAELPTKTAVRLAAEITGAPRNRLYDAALAIKQAAEEDPIED
ncbi:16S rRNA (cytidine(1402)-2'-O)-methyltransferase, partial [Delftia sp. BR1]